MLLPYYKEYKPKMLGLSSLADIRMQQHIAHEIYRLQIMQSLPDHYSSMLPYGMAPSHYVPTHSSLPGNVEAKLENNELWQQFHNIGTEMIITKCGRRMFPSFRVALSGLEEESSYCVLLEMMPLNDCRYKFSGTQWVPAGGAEQQSTQRMYLHPDSPATGAHWQAQALLFNKVKLTNNTLDNNGHIVLASMHKYQIRLHILRSSEVSQFPWAPQQAFVFAATEFIAVTAYQNDRITRLKIDNNPFAKGFRESGQSRCKRKLSTAADDFENVGQQVISHEDIAQELIMPLAKRMHSILREEHSALAYAPVTKHCLSTLPMDRGGVFLPHFTPTPALPNQPSIRLTDSHQHQHHHHQHHHQHHHHQHHQLQRQQPQQQEQQHLPPQQPQQQQQLQQIDYARHIAAAPTGTSPNWSHSHMHSSSSSASSSASLDDSSSQISDCGDDDFVDVVSTTSSSDFSPATPAALPSAVATAKRNSSFSISDILGNNGSATER